MEKKLLTAEETLNAEFNDITVQFKDSSVHVGIIKVIRAYALQEVHIALEKAANEAKTKEHRSEPKLTVYGSIRELKIIVDKQSITGIKIELT